MNLTFAHPSFFWLLLFLPLLVALKLAADARARSLLKRAVAARLTPVLVTSSPAWRSWTALGLEMMALLLLLTTMARPQMGFVEEEVLTSGRSILFALDTSRSMLANDMEPNRLTRTKLVMLDLINKLKSDRIGLIAFAGKSFVQAPITQDHEALLETLDQCDTEIIPRGGSNLSEAIDLAVETFKGTKLPPGKTLSDLSPAERTLLEKSQATNQALIIFSDGEELEGAALTAAKEAAAANVTIISVGVGTKQGGIIPSPETRGRDYIRDDKGKLVKTALQQEVLEAVARATNGLYLPLTEVLTDNRLNLILSKLDSGSNKNKTLKKAVERYQWPLVGSLLFLLAGAGVRVLRSRRNALRHSGSAGNISLPPPLPKHAHGWTVVLVAVLLTFTVNVAQAFKRPAGNEPEAPKEKLHDPKPYEKSLAELTKTYAGGADHLAWQRLGEGSVAYANGEWDTALEKFGKALLGKDSQLQSQAHFNLANTIYQRTKLFVEGEKNPNEKTLAELISKLNDSIAQYQHTLDLDPNHKDAAANKKELEEFVKKVRLEKTKKEQQKKEKGKKGDKSDGDKPDEGNEEQGDKPQEGEGKEKGDQEKGEEESDDGSGKKGQGQDGKDGAKRDGTAGDKPNDKDPKEGAGSGDKDDKNKDGTEDKRTAQQKADDKKAQDDSNREFQKPSDKPGDNAGDKKGDKKTEIAEQKKLDMKKDQRTGYSRSSARQKLERFSDTVDVRPQFDDTARSDRPFKNW
jgi:Ca-activated chloride channel family protein